MKDVATKLLPVEKHISEQRGPFRLFALFQREDALDFWDLLVSAAWIADNKEASIRLIVAEATKVLTQDELIKLSRVVVIEANNPALDAINKAIHVKGGIAEVSNSNFFGLQIRHAYIITSTSSK
jgi:hypothetical protein